MQRFAILGRGGEVKVGNIAAEYLDPQGLCTSELGEIPACLPVYETGTADAQIDCERTLRILRKSPTSRCFSTFERILSGRSQSTMVGDRGR